MTLSSRVTIALAANVVVALLLVFIPLRFGRALGVPESGSWAVALLLMVPVVLWSGRWTLRSMRRTLRGLDDGLLAFRDGDFSMRLASAAENDEATTVKLLYNEVADALRKQRADIYQKELLLDTILQRTPIAVVLRNEADRVVYSNAAARELFAGGLRIDGRVLGEILDDVPVPMREAVVVGGDVLVTLRLGEQEETFHLMQRAFRLNTLEHRLLMVERLTAELRRQEVAVWKKAIRVINHELNNSIAPISSLFHSAKLAQGKPERRDRLQEIYETIEERLAFLKTFFDSYARFARLPPPNREHVRWSDLLADIRALYRFRLEGDASGEAFIDPTQVQQVLINLLKNADESGSDPEAIVLRIQRANGATVIRVSDRGCGMPADVMRQALVPFYTTKPGGSGLGLALSNEIVEAHNGRMRLAAGEGGGTVVTVWIPDA
jgi:nitrogen fixation/metabolism regulation signal transduction histidine kinase